MEQAGVPVDVSTFERDPLLGTEAGERSDDRDGSEARAELDRDRLDVGERLERRNLAPLRLRVRDEARDVLLDEPGANRVGEHLPEPLVNPPGGPLREAFPPRAELGDVQPVDADGLEAAGAVQRRTFERVPKPGLERPESVRLRVVLACVEGRSLSSGAAKRVRASSRAAAPRRHRDRPPPTQPSARFHAEDSVRLCFV